MLYRHLTITTGILIPLLTTSVLYQEFSHHIVWKAGAPLGARAAACAVCCIFHDLPAVTLCLPPSDCLSVSRSVVRAVDRQLVGAFPNKVSI